MIQHISKLFENGASEPALSLEFFPPRDAAAEQRLLEKTLPSLLRHPVAFCSVTHGAGGSGSGHDTLGLVQRIQERDVNCLMHINRMARTRDQLTELVTEAQRAGIRNYLALGGDAINGEPNGERMRYASEIVETIRALNGADACVGAAGFPEGNNAFAESCYSNWAYLVEKIAAGVDFVITQMFFTNANFLRFRDFVVDRLGRDIPIIPGVMPITPDKPLDRFIELTGARVSRELRDALDRHADDPEGLRKFGIEYAVRQSEELLAAGVPGIHYYCLNRASPSAEVLAALSR